jgi:hypothetical protein
MPRDAWHRHNVDTNQFSRLAPAIGDRRTEQNILIRRGGEPGII